MSVETGSLHVLNTGAGDINISFNADDDTESERAIGMLLDMQKRGYAIMVRQDDGTYQRAQSIDRETRSYVVLTPGTSGADAITPDEESAAKAPKKARKPVKTKQSIKGRKAVAVARSAGGCARQSPGTLLALARGSGSLSDGRSP